MTYSVKEIFYTLQGEGVRAGTPAVFCRFAGCNLWSGDEAARSRSLCRFCDTDFVGTDGTGGGKYPEAAALAQAIAAHWPTDWKGPTDLKGEMQACPWVVLTGGEPLLQVDQALIEALHQRGFQIAVETNGSLAPPSGIDWLCVSPKAFAPWVHKQGDELKVVWPQPGWTAADLVVLETQGQFTHRVLQPLDDAFQTQNEKQCVALCLARPQWRLSLQTHKHLGLR
jgi:7-carboxy-7-deazaguanine synthase